MRDDEHDGDRDADDDKTAPEPTRPLPTPPDPRRIQELRRQFERDLRRRRAPGRSPSGLAPHRGKQIRDIGAYTMIPAMLLAGPALGYGLGWVIQDVLGGAPYPAAGGMLFGLAAAFRQIYLLLAGRTAPPPRRGRGEGGTGEDRTGDRP